MKTGCWYIVLISVLLSFPGCRKSTPYPLEEQEYSLSIFSINDPHGQIDNFGKIKYIVDEAESEGDVIVVSAGDIFSGNAVVDFIEEKGYPMIDLMNLSGFDVAALGNHEFDYGQDVLKDRMEQAEFEFILANADMSGSVVPQPEPYITLSLGELDVTFLGMVETSYTSGTYIPATHPLKVKEISFYQAEDVIGNYENLKEETDADLVVLLSHLGAGMDYYMAQHHPYMDLIIGGHSHAKIDDIYNDVYIYQCGSNLNYLGRISLTIKGKEIISEEFELIDLNSYPYSDSNLESVIAAYNDVPELDEVIGYNNSFISGSTGLGCLYTDALRSALNTDISFQNSGGIRNVLNEGDITVREIYAIDPFNNGAHTYTMSVEQIKRFLEETGTGLHYSGVILENDANGGIILSDLAGNELSNETTLSVGINDYIPAVFSYYFPGDPLIDEMTTAELIIDYIRANPSLSYSGCNNYFQATK